MRITSIAGAGVLSFDQFTLGLTQRITVIVGPNGAGKSNLGRMLTICHRAVERADGAAGDVDRLLVSFLAARHASSPASAVEARVGLELDTPAERALVVEFVRSMVLGQIAQNGVYPNMAELDAWADAEITEDKLRPLMQGRIVASHPGTPDGRWQCAFEFTAASHEGDDRSYRWVVLGDRQDTIFQAGSPLTGGSDIRTRLTGSSEQPRGPDIAIPPGFSFLDLIPKPDLPTASCAFSLPGEAFGSQRRFAQMTGRSLIDPGGRRNVGFAAVLRTVLRMRLRQTSDTRLLPQISQSWSAADASLIQGAEGRLPEMPRLSHFSGVRGREGLPARMG